MLKRATVTTNKAPAAKKSSVPEITVQGSVVTRFNAAVKAMKDAEATVNLLRPDVLEAGLGYIFRETCAHPQAPVMSVKVVDAEGQVARVTMQEKYSFADADVASAVFEAFGKDINDYAVETSKASFDQKFFLDESGNFDQEAFEAIQTSVNEAVLKLNARRAQQARPQKTNPLSTKLIVTAKPSFHEARFKDFNAAQQRALSEVLPNTNTVTPVAA